MTYSEVSFQGEERLVAELAQLGVNYLSRQENVETIPRLPRIILAELVRQQSSRVRTALISRFSLQILNMHLKSLQHSNALGPEIL
jgi:hypothetical protein